MSAVPVQPAAAPTELCPVAFRDFHSPEPFPLELGGVLPELTLRYETYGTLLPDKSNAILVPHALGATTTAAATGRTTSSRAGGMCSSGPARPSTRTASSSSA
jgi:homoserine O-acetyltransferase